jgi:hypothetical protein
MYIHCQVVAVECKRACRRRLLRQLLLCKLHRRWHHAVRKRASVQSPQSLTGIAFSSCSICLSQGQITPVCENPGDYIVVVVVAVVVVVRCRCLLSAVCCLLSAVCCLLSAVCCWLFGWFGLLVVWMVGCGCGQYVADQPGTNYFGDVHGPMSPCSLSTLVENSYNRSAPDFTQTFSKYLGIEKRQHVNDDVLLACLTS